jgi:uncharacterized GH25 family protein
MPSRIFTPLSTAFMVLSATLVSTIAPAHAHDFWMSTQRYQVPAGTQEPHTIRFRIGHDYEQEPWRLIWERVVGLRRISPEGRLHNHLSDITVNAPNKEGNARLTFAEPGTHMIFFESNHSFIELPADRFNAHAKKEGLTLALADRALQNKSEAPGRELFSRRAKLLLQVGDAYSDTVTRPVGLTLEIVPEANPYALPAGAPLSVQVLYRGKPLTGATIDMEQLRDNPALLESKVTDAQGRASFVVPRQGEVKLNVIWATPLEPQERADFETIFSSLTLGF